MTLENEIRLLEDEIARLRDDGLVTPNTSTSSGIDDLDRTLQAFRSNERLLKSKVEMLTGEISKRDCEIYTLQSRLEMTDKQHQDQTHHINVLKEQLKTREHKISMLTADTEDFRKRLKEKESQLEKKAKGASATQAAKRQLEGELTDLKDQLDIKERKLSLLQRKIDNLEDLLNDKEVQLAASKARLSRIGGETIVVEGQLTTQEDVVKERERQLERLRSMQQRAGGEYSDEIEAQKRLISDLRNRIETLQREADEKTNQVLELREELSQLRTNRFKYETEINQLQAQINQRASEISSLQMEKQMQHKQITTECELKYAHRIGELESQVNHYMENSSRLQSEVDRLLRSLDSEKFDREKQLHELREELHETQNNLSNIKRTQQTERKKHTQQLEETRQREENARSDVEILKGIMSEKDSRIRELEQALRESVRLTAEREIYASGRDDESRQLEHQRAAVIASHHELIALISNPTGATLDYSDPHTRQDTCSSTPPKERGGVDARTNMVTERANGNYALALTQPKMALSQPGMVRRANHELTLKVAQLQLDLDDRERQLRAVERMHTTVGVRQGNEFSEMAVLRRELTTAKADREAELSSLTAQLDKTTQEKAEVCAEVQELRSLLAEKTKQLRAVEAEKDKETIDRENMQKKYEAVLTQLSEKSEKLQRLEADCQKTHVEELKRQLSELEDLRHHTTYLQNTIKERENRIETVEKESFKLRDELSNIRRQLNSSVAELKSLQEEGAYREERFRQMQAQQNEELSRLRSINQEQVSRNSHLEMKLEEKEHELKTRASEIRCQLDEITRLQSSVEDVNSRLSVSQKRAEERETRLRKLESENSTYDGVSSAVSQDLERVRRQHADLTHTYEQTLKQLEDLQIQYDQMTLQRNGLRAQLDEEIEKRAKLEEQLRSNEDQWKARVSQVESSAHSKQLFMELTDLRNELERKQAQIACLSKELELFQSSSSERERLSGTTSQHLQLVDLQVRLRQMTEERDHAKEQLNEALTRAESTYLDAQQQLIIEKQTLQERLTNLTQSAHNATSEADRYQREARQASARVQQLSRQLQETQNNCDAIARQRDSLQDQLNQLRRSMGRNGSGATGTLANLFGMGTSGSFGATGGMRPASAGAGSYDNAGLFSTGGSMSHLSRELDRVHREYEALQNQMREVQEVKEASETEAENLRNELLKIKEEAQQQELKIREMQESTDNVKQEMENRYRQDQEKAQMQQNETMQKLNWTQQQLNEQTNQMQQTVSQLNSARQRSSELEQTVKELTQRLQSAEPQAQYQRSELESYHQARSEGNTLRNELRSKEAEIKQLNIQYDQLTREYENLQRSMEQMTIELSTAHAQLQQLRDLPSVEQTIQSSRETNDETMRIMKQEIKEAAVVRNQMEQELAKLQSEVQMTRGQLDEKIQDIAILEGFRTKQQEDIRNLQRELQMARAQLEDLGGSTEADSNGGKLSLKAEIDTLKREISRRDDTITAMERDCQEKHLRRLEALHTQLRRFEEETENLNKVLDEQRAGLEERDHVIRQLRSQQGQVSSVEFEKLRTEHSRCKEHIDQQTKRIETLARQIENQSDELLAIKLESLTASLCEKEANIALMELTAPKNAASEKALNKLRAEKDELQIQQKQLANTRAMLEEEKKSRR
ncbi:unnamed protein product [Dicrocoelium dendriticum]|nr:unnamed protein product [Dicrocoelium dendriticum]